MFPEDCELLPLFLSPAGLVTTRQKYHRLDVSVTNVAQQIFRYFLHKHTHTIYNQQAVTAHLITFVNIYHTSSSHDQVGHVNSINQLPNILYTHYAGHA